MITSKIKGLGNIKNFLILSILFLFSLFLVGCTIEDNTYSHCKDNEVLYSNGKLWKCINPNELLNLEEDIFKIYFNHSVYNIVKINMSKNTEDIITTHTTNGEKFIFGDELI